MATTVLSEAQRLYTTAYSRWCYELSHDKNVTTAKDIAMYICDFALPWDEHYFWKAVKSTIQRSNHLSLYKP